MYFIMCLVSQALLHWKHKLLWMECQFCSKLILVPELHSSMLMITMTIFKTVNSLNLMLNSMLTPGILSVLLASVMSHSLVVVEGNGPPLLADKCKHKNTECNYCHKTGHLERAFLSRKRTQHDQKYVKATFKCKYFVCWHHWIVRSSWRYWCTLLCVKCHRLCSIENTSDCVWSASFVPNWYWCRSYTHQC